MEVGLFLRLLLQELFELFLLLINLKSVHIVLTLIIREKVIIRFSLAISDAETFGAQLSPLQIPIKRLVLSVLLRHRRKHQIMIEKLFDRFGWYGARGTRVQSNHCEQENELMEE